VGGHPVGQDAAALPWLAPAAPTLLALADGGPPGRLAADPGAVLLALRYARPSPTPADALSQPGFDQPILRAAAAAHLDARHDGWADPTCEAVADVLRAAGSIAAHARHLATVTRRCPPAAAHVAGLLAPLGWLAVAAVDPDALDAARLEPRFADDPQRAQETVWGLAGDAIVRRLVARWRLPHWLTGTLSTFTHATEDAESLGAEPGLVAVLRAAVALAERDGHRFGLLGLSTADDVADLVAVGGAAPGPHLAVAGPLAAGDDPRDVPLLSHLLRSAAAGRRAGGDSHDALDRLHRQLSEARAGFERAVRDAKLSGLAELAAGAGHEINNPLAIISGNAQLLRNAADEDDRRDRLDTIVRQTRRIADILRDLRQFARPPLPLAGFVRLADVIDAVVAEMTPAADAGLVRLAADADPAAAVQADRGQLHKAVARLVGNAVEAAPADGTVRVTAGADGETVTVAVEDTGPGVPPANVQHLFDPFFSGRSAGRGRGLGLSTAWRYATLNGGTIRYERPAGGPTRFVMTFPAAGAPPVRFPERRSA
jgi:signal transduction histidine kinase